MELELTEPQLYFNDVPAATDRIAATIEAHARRLQGHRSTDGVLHCWCWNDLGSRFRARELSKEDRRESQENRRRRRGIRLRRGQAFLSGRSRLRCDGRLGARDVHGLDLASGKKVWEYASPVTSSPAVAKGKVVVATADGQVICFG
jgi:hypothetical protein